MVVGLFQIMAQGYSLTTPIRRQRKHFIIRVQNTKKKKNEKKRKKQNTHTQYQLRFFLGIRFNFLTILRCVWCYFFFFC